MRKKTYGVMGLMEWNCIIDNGHGVRLHVPFTGGYENKFGIQPATYVTSNAVAQHIIEHSDYFIRGRIVLLHDSVMEVSAERPDSKRQAVTDDGLDLSAMGMGDVAGDNGADGAGDSGLAVTDGSEGVSDQEGGGAVVEVTSLDDCKRFLNSHYGIAVRNLRSKSQIMQEASSRGVTFKGL